MTFVAKTKRLLTIPQLKFVQDQPRYVKVTGAMHKGKDLKPKEGEKKRQPATLADCINLEDGSVCQIIVSAVVKSVLTDEYPNDGYVGRCFSITKKGRNPAKSYNDFLVEEIEDPAAEAGATEEVARPAPTPLRGGRRA